MKITHLVENLNRGGLERVVINLVMNQQDAGHDCRVVCLYEQGALADELKERGVAVDACGKRGGLDLRALRRLRALLRNTEVLHSHNIIAHDYGVLAASGLPMRRILNTRHGIGIAPRGAMRRWLYLRCVPRTDHVVAVCRAAQRNLAEHDRIPADKIAVVPNGIHIERFAPASADARARLATMLGVDRSTRLIGCVGRLNWAKDIPTQIRAFARVCATRADTALVLIGDGSLRAELTELAAAEGVAGSVHFLGDRGDVRDLLPGLHVFSMSSVSEGYSIALLEACATALPIVATDVGGNSEIVQDGATGRIVPPRDPEALANALLDILADPERGDEMGRRGHAWARTHGTVQAMAERYDVLYTAPGQPR